MKDELYTKYRVFKEPENSRSHPALIYAHWEGEPLEEVEDFVFVLKPDSDHHARVALAAYAESCRQELPQLSDDLYLVMQTGFDGV